VWLKLLYDGRDLWIYPSVATASRLSERRHCRKQFHFQVGFTVKLERLHTIGYFSSPYKQISQWNIMITAWRDVISVLSKWVPAFRGNQVQPSGMWHRKAWLVGWLVRRFGETDYNLLGCDIAKPGWLVGWLVGWYGVSEKPIKTFWDVTSQSLVGWYGVSEKPITTFWEVTSQSLVDGYRCFGKPLESILKIKECSQGVTRKVLWSSALKMESTDSSEMLLPRHQTIQRHTPKDSNICTAGTASNVTQQAYLEYKRGL
jgi:hypothetical protein